MARTKMIGAIFWILFILFICFLPKIGFADNSQVQVNSSYNQDTPGWGTTRFNRIQEAVNNVPEGGVIIVNSGTYKESIVINKSLTLRAEDANDPPVIDGNKSKTTLHLKSSGIIIDGFKLIGGDPCILVEI